MDDIDGREARRCEHRVLLMREVADGDVAQSVELRSCKN